MPAVTLDVVAKLAEKKLRVVRVPLQLDSTPDANGNAPEPYDFYLGEFDPHEIQQRLWGLIEQNQDTLKDLLFGPLLVAASLCDQDRKWLVSTADEIIQLARKFQSGGVLSGIKLQTLAQHAEQLNMLTKEQLEAIEKKLPTTPTNAGSGG